MLKASELQKENQDRKRRTRENYKRLLDDCCNRIKSANGKGLTAYTYRLSGVIADMPLIDVNAALLYISKKLVKGGFKVVYYAPNAIHIDWTRG